MDDWKFSAVTVVKLEKERDMLVTFNEYYKKAQC